ncbi:DUF6173 family protein [Kurthia massiliensis]|uniref:DUF6173 family protein n=1 Tax=Kurthia massiliensis TaxID=1033739 RepID=UPI000287B0CB|nr:DUF6173 family protein [Kurthia massiliensis]
MDMINKPTEQAKAAVMQQPEVDQNLASEFHKRIMEMIADFESELDEAHEIGVKLVNFGQTVQFNISGIGYYNPSLIHFHGQTESGNRIELVQHVSQISFLLMAVKKADPDPEVPPKRIGFIKDDA